MQRLSAEKRYKWAMSNKKQSRSLNECLSKCHWTVAQDFTLTKRLHLHNETEEPKTLHVDFTFDNSEVSYDPGDHLSIFPRNETRKVEYLKSRMNNNPPSDKLVTLQVDNGGFWENQEDLPSEVLIDDLLYYFLDINMVPSQQMLDVFATYAVDKKRERNSHLPRS